MKKAIIKTTTDFVKEYHLKNNTQTIWQEPLVGFGDCKNKLFDKYKEIIDTDYLSPYDILPDASIVISYFVPFTRDMVQSNIGGDMPSKQWAVAYVETNKLLSELGSHLVEHLKTLGVKSVVPSFPSPGFDNQKLISYWSQRHTAYICGLGTFGINNMLITDKGCCGRFGSIVTNASAVSILPDKPCQAERCLYKFDGSCQKCVDLCVTKALTTNSFDRQKCYEFTLEVDNHYSDIGLSEVCGKCLSGVPCSFVNPNKTNNN